MRRTATDIGPIAIAGLLAAYATSAILVPPAMFSDSGWGFAVWRSMQQGGPFNWLVQADPLDIGRDAGAFMSTWSPGQYLIPGFLTTLGLSLGHALVITVTLASVVGLIGWARLYRRLHYTSDVVVIACAMIAMNRFFVLPFGIYNGGEVLMFAGAPYILLTALWAAQAPARRSLLLIPVLLAGFVLKNAALVLGLAMCTALVFQSWRSNDRTERLIGWARWPAVFVATYIIVYLLYTSRGWSAADVMAHLAPHATAGMLFAVAGPMMGAISLDEGLSRLLSNPGREIYAAWYSSVAIMAPLAGVAGLLYAWTWRSQRGRESAGFCAVVVAVYIAVFAALNALGSAVSSDREARHLRIAGLVLLPAAVATARSTSRRSLRVAVAAVGLVACAYGLTSAITKWRYLRRLDAVGSQGFTQTSIDREALGWLVATDAESPAPRTLFYVSAPELAIEVRHQRVVVASADFETEEMLASRHYAGRVERLFVIVPERFVPSGKAQVILNSFTDYHRWESRAIGAFRIFTGGDR